MSRQTGRDVRVAVSAPYLLDVTSKANRTWARAVQVGIQPDTIFVDLVTIEHRPTLLYASFVHQGEITLDEEATLAPAVQRLKEV